MNGDQITPKAIAEQQPVQNNANCSEVCNQYVQEEEKRSCIEALVETCCLICDCLLCCLVCCDYDECDWLTAKKYI